MQNYSDIPEELKALPHWVVHRKKVPYTPGTGRMAKSNDPTTWRTFDEAAADQAADGIGFMFSGSGYVGIDIDHCIGRDGQYNEQAADAMAILHSYTEVSTSGDGLHIICKGNVPGDRNRNIPLGMEIYDSGRYFVMTGNIVEGYDTIRDCQDDINQLYATYYAEPELPLNETTTEDAAPDKAPDAPRTLSMDELMGTSEQDTLKILNRIKGPTGNKVRALLRGDMTGYKSQSEADIALCNYLAFYCKKDPADMDRIFRGSGLMRPKWDEKHGDKTYGQLTIDKAMAGTQNVYDPELHRINRIVKKLAKANIDEEMAQQLLNIPYTDAGYAERMQLLYNDRIFFCQGNQNPWHVFSGLRWKPVPRLFKPCVYMSRTLRDIVEKYEAPDPMDTAALKAYRAKMVAIKACEGTGKIKNIMEQFAELVTVDTGRLDADPMLLNVQNGTLDLRTGQLRPHDRCDLITKLCCCQYRPARAGSLWEQTITQCVPDAEARHWLQKWFGYCLTGSTKESKFLLLYGTGGTGKSTVVETIGHMLGDYADVVNINVFLTGSFTDGNNATPEIAKLLGVRQVRTAEAPMGKHFNAAKLKWFTGGDLITARHLRRASFTFAPQFKLTISSNYAPAMADINDEGMRRRLVIFPFDVQFQGKAMNINLAEELRRPANLADVLAWCVEGCMMWQREGLGELPQVLKKALGQYYTDNDMVQQFIEECCTLDPSYRVTVAYLYQSFINYACNGTRYKPMTRKYFVQAMERKGFPQQKYNNGQNFQGISLSVNGVFQV